jgi:hypothetical protein
MASMIEHPARGKVTALVGDRVEFSPAGTTYTLHLAADGGRYDGPLGTPVSGFVRVKARKLYSVPSGGNFIQPITGEPRIVQGRVMAIAENQLVLRAGTHVLVDLPADDAALDLANGEVRVGGMVNVVCYPGATFAPLVAAAT